MHQKLDSANSAGFTYYYCVLSRDIHNNPSSRSPEAVAAFPTSINITVSSGWSMVSVPLDVSDYLMNILFPGASAGAFAYEGHYIRYGSNDTLKAGVGYWVKYANESTIHETGFRHQDLTVHVAAGWNMIGAPSTPIRCAEIISEPPGLVTSNFFYYNGSSYISADSLEPGKGYWVKVSNDGELRLTSSIGTQPTNRIKIVNTQEMPPPPPDGFPGPALPKEYAMDQNYPNPFNPVTTLTYALPIDSRVSVRVYNTLGQMVALLANEVQQAGYKSLEWNASNIASGVYFYRFEATSVSDPTRTFTQVKKMIVLK